MHVVYAQEPLPTDPLPAVFLAGPTPRSPDVPSWRPEALQILERLAFDGLVFVPEPRDGVWKNDYTFQIEWEDEGLRRADCIAFWIARRMDTMPALTTNDEWGTWKASGKCVLGLPEWAEHVRYQRFHANKLGVPIFTTLPETLRAAVALVSRPV